MVHIKCNGESRGVNHSGEGIKDTVRMDPKVHSFYNEIIEAFCGFT